MFLIAKRDGCPESLFLNLFFLNVMRVLNLSWGEGTDSQIHNTFTYQREMDSWAWRIDNVRNGKASNFARVALHRLATQTD